MEPNQPLQLAGARMILLAYLLLQLGRLRPQTWIYGMLNLVGAALLAWEAWRTVQWGFILLEGAWVAISVAGLARASRRAASASAPAR